MDDPLPVKTTGGWLRACLLSALVVVQINRDIILGWHTNTQILD